MGKLSFAEEYARVMSTKGEGAAKGVPAANAAFGVRQIFATEVYRGPKSINTKQRSAVIFRFLFGPFHGTFPSGEDFS